MKIIVTHKKTNRQFKLDAVNDEKRKLGNGRIHKVGDKVADETKVDETKVDETNKVEDKKVELTEKEISALKELAAVASDLVKLVKPDDKSKSKSESKSKSKDDDKDADADEDEDVIEEDEQMDSSDDNEPIIEEEEIAEEDSDIDEDEDDEEDVIEDECGDNINDSKASIGSIEVNNVGDSDTLTQEEKVAKAFDSRYSKDLHK